MKLITTVLAVLSLFVIYSPPATAQDEDCWHYENGDAYLIGGVDTPDWAHSVAVAGSYAYVGDTSSLQVIDITDPTSPQLVGSVDPPFLAGDVVVVGSYAYVAGDGLHVIDITDPASPQLVGYVDVDTNYFTHCVAIAGSYAYMANCDAGLQVIDIADPTNPLLVGSVDTPGHAAGTAVADSYAYVADWYTGLQVIDITDPTNPQLVCSVDTPDYANGVAVVGSYAYVADWDSGLQVIDISDPTNPQLVGDVGTPDRAYNVAVAGSYAYVADGWSGLQVIDITDPVDPQHLGGVDTPHHTNDVAVAEPYVYIAAEIAGLVIAWQQCDDVTAVVDDPEEVPSARLRLAAHPNPFNPQTTITFSLERDEWTEVGVYELTGRRVTILANREFTAGNHSLLWNGRESRGRAMPSGTYVVRLDSESGVEARKVLLLR